MNSQESTEVVSTYNEYLERLDSATRHFSEDLEASNFRVIGEVLPAIIEGFEWVNEAASRFVTLQKVKPEIYQNFQNTITTMGDALENKDYPLLHDVLEYDLLPIFKEMKVVMN